MAGILAAGLLRAFLGAAVYTGAGEAPRREVAYEKAPPEPLLAPQEAPLGLDVVNRTIIYTARLRLEVADVDGAIAGIRRIANEHGGFVSGVSVSKEGGRRAARITIRVPQLGFYAAIGDVEGLGSVMSKDVEGRDVTEQYVDLQARLNNLRRQEERLLEILDMCETVDEILRVESELGRVRGEIERLTGQLQYLERRVELSSITAMLEETIPPALSVIPEVDWTAPIRIGLLGAFTVIQALMVAAIMAAPIAAIGAPVYYAWRRTRSNRCLGGKEGRSRDRMPPWPSAAAALRSARDALGEQEAPSTLLRAENPLLAERKNRSDGAS